MKGVVYRSTGSWYQVKDLEGKFWSARMKGIFKLDDITSTNPIAVGDHVEMVLEDEKENSCMITRIHDRDNHINRQSPRMKSQQHIVAANIDQSILIATLREPRTSQGFIDRFLVASEMYHIPAAVVFNKTDLYREKEQRNFERLREVYESVGYQVLGISLRNDSSKDQLYELLKNKISLISGHSGVGKTTFINTILPSVSLKTQDVSGWSGKGQHTTTFAEMFDLPEPLNGKIIDTPGMKEFGLVNLDRQEVSGYFPEMKRLMLECQFNDCLHINEPGCAIKDAVIDGRIDEDRYVNYVNILESINERKWE